jgi:hypothetical protein
MVTAVRDVPRGLSPQDLSAIRDTLATGRKPKVTFTAAAGQIAGQTGQVVELTDPALSEEWVVVRFGKDELPFSPADLAVPSRAPAGRKAESRPPAAPELKVVPEGSAAAGAGADGPVGRGSPAPPGSTPEPMPAAPAEGRARKASRPAKVRPPAALTVTLAYADGEWTVAAQQGAKALAKPYLIRPSEALKMVGMLDVPGVHEAVEQILAAERAAAEHRAERLRAELADIEAKLAELRAAG